MEGKYFRNLASIKVIESGMFCGSDEVVVNFRNKLTAIHEFYSHSMLFWVFYYRKEHYKHCLYGYTSFENIGHSFMLARKEVSVGSFLI